MPKENFGNVEITYDMLAYKAKRFGNNFIDSIICYAIVLVIGEFGNLLYANYGYDGLAIGNLESSLEKFNLLYIVISTMYYGLFESFSARTPAKHITGTKVVMRDGTKPDSTAILIRTLCRLIPFEAFSFLFGQFAIGWHDSISKTLVVDINKYNSALQKKGGTDTKGDDEAN